MPRKTPLPFCYEIYLIVNRINNKIYVGQAVYGREFRWKTHLTACNQGEQNYLYNAFRKYGTENFDVHLITRAENKQELDEYERQWIAFLDSKNPDIGYNMSDGGCGSGGLKHGPWAKTRAKGWKSGETNGRYREDVSTEEIADLYIGGKSCVQIADQLGINKTVVLKRLKGAGVARRELSTAAKIRHSIPENNPAYRKDVSTEEIVRLFGQGLSYRKISKKVNLSDTCVMLRLRKLGLSCPVKNSTKMVTDPLPCLGT